MDTGFFNYLGQLLIAALWNPNNPLWSFVTWITFLYACVLWVLPGTKTCIETKMKQFSHLKKPILLFLVFASLVIAAYTLQENAGCERPLLSIQDVAVSAPNEERETTIILGTKNVGKGTAYHSRFIILATPSSHIGKTDDVYRVYIDAINPNPIHIGNLTTIKIVLKQPNQAENMSAQNAVWFVYCKQIYYDADKNGRLFSEENWYSFTYGIASLNNANKQQMDVYEPVVRKFLEGVEK